MSGLIAPKHVIRMAGKVRRRKPTVLITLIDGKRMHHAALIEALNKKVEKLLDEAAERTKANGRKTMRPEDL